MSSPPYVGVWKRQAAVHKKPLVVAIEGPVGSGKGFLLKYIRQRGLDNVSVQVQLHDDAVPNIVDCHRDTSRWGLFTELDFLFRHVQAYVQIQKSRTADVILLEGSHVADRFCYFELIRNQLTPVEQRLYEDWIGVMCEFNMSHKTIFLDCDPHDCLHRIINNNKREQCDIDLTEISRLRRLYEKNLPHDALRIACAPNFEDNEPLLESMRKRVSSVVDAWTTEAC